MSEINLKLRDHWDALYPKYPTWRGKTDKEEYRPWNELYLNSGSDLPQKKWLAEHGYHDFRFDMAIRDYSLCVELDGHGKGHLSPKKVQRDREKANSWLKLGGIVLRYSVQTVKINIDYVCDDIYEILDVHFRLE